MSDCADSFGQPAQKTLDAAKALDSEAQTLGAIAERIPLLNMISHAYWRLGDTHAGEEVASECMKLAETVADPTLLGESLIRLASAVQQTQPARSVDIHQRALELWESLGDRRGQIRCHANLGGAHALLGNWEQAKVHLTTAISIGRTAGAPDVWGAAALNLGVVYLKGGEFDRARELFGESLALFAAAKNSERQLYALFNLAHLDRDRHEYNSAAELYDVATSLAQRIGHSDVEIGAIAGSGLSLFAQGKAESAREKFETASERMRARNDWFQGRELVEALGVHVWVHDGLPDQSLARFEEALTMADSADLYVAAWLTAACAEPLYPVARDRVRDVVASYVDRVKGLGYNEINRKLEGILART